MVKSIFESLVSMWVFFNTFREHSAAHDFLIFVGVLVCAGFFLGNAAFWVCLLLLVINEITYDSVKDKYGR